ncbi:hypothetical protein M885DRAFT_522257 [Pelagophyceae sp. CCMP2097]|nr:hypothetical protein M885DRAFT_522257 [Pelagophyceae sp. CCMP2097]
MALWTCRSCTLQNAQGTSACGACGEPRARPPAPKRGESAPETSAESRPPGPRRGESAPPPPPRRPGRSASPPPALVASHRRPQRTGETPAPDEEALPRPRPTPPPYDALPRRGPEPARVSRPETARARTTQPSPRSGSPRTEPSPRTAVSPPGAGPSRTAPFRELSDSDYDRAEAKAVALSRAEARLQAQERERLVSTNLGSPAEIAVLAALNTRVEAIDVEAAQRIFDMMDGDGDGTLNISEIRSGCEIPAVREYIRSTRNVTLKGLLKGPARQDKCLKALAHDAGGQSVSKDQWLNFVRGAARERVRWMKSEGLRNGRCYWGRGLDGVKRADCCFAACGYPRGFAEDFGFYCRNNHPLLSWCFRDDTHPLSRLESFSAEVVVRSFCLFASVYVDRNRSQRDWYTAEGLFKNFWATTLYVTLPVLVLTEVLFYLLACPCVHYERRGRRREKYLCCFKGVAECIGHLIVYPATLTGLVVIAWGFYKLGEDVSKHKTFAYSFALATVSSYLFWPLLKLGLQFNLICTDDSCCPLLGLFGFGRWASERRRAAKAFLNASEDDVDVVKSFEYVLRQATVRRSLDTAESAALRAATPQGAARSASQRTPSTPRETVYYA